jgi:hypothetical protein
MASPSPATDPWAQLSELRVKAQDDDAYRVIFNAGLRDFHEAGWTYRQLGKANGISHETVRLAILDIPEEVTSSGIEAPPRPKSLSVIPLRELDPKITADLKARLSAAVEADPGQRTASGIKSAVADYFAALHNAEAAGWDAYSLAHALGSHPKAIFKFIAQHERYGEGKAPPLPDAPHRAEPTLYRASRPALPPVKIPDDDVQKLHLLEQEAAGETGTSQDTVYQALLGVWYLLGANREELERATGQQWETIRKRLVRAGYMSGKPRPSTRAKPKT